MDFSAFWAKGINRQAIPPCVVWSIRKLFPEADGQYTRFKEGERDWLDAYTIYKT